MYGDSSCLSNDLATSNDLFCAQVADTLLQFASYGEVPALVAPQLQTVGQSGFIASSGSAPKHGSLRELASLSRVINATNVCPPDSP